MQYFNTDKLVFEVKKVGMIDRFIKKIIHIFIGVISVLFLLFAFYMIHQIRNFENDEVPSKHHFTVTISSKESY